MNTNDAHLRYSCLSVEQKFDLAFDNIKELILSRAWCRADYQRMTSRLESIREQMKQHCDISALAHRPAIVEHIVMLIINSDMSVLEACSGFNISDS